MSTSRLHSAGQVWIVKLEPTIGSEIQKCRPCLIISPNEMNRYLRIVIVAPRTTSEQSYPARVRIDFSGKSGQVALDQMRSVDKARLVQHLDQVEMSVLGRVAALLVEMFAV